MKKLLAAMSVMIVVVLLPCAPASQAKVAPTAKITVHPRPPSKPLKLAVGESRTFEIRVTSNEPFGLVMAMTDEYYPGRGIYWHDSDRATRNTSAVLHLTMTGKSSTADLAAVCDWPGPGDCWPEGVAPVNIVVGVRYKGGRVVVQQFPFAVEVP
jgi:hypothetical protein